MKGWKTVILGVLVGLIGMLSNEDMVAFIGEYLPVISGSLGTIIIVLRFLTNSGIFKKE